MIPMRAVSSIAGWSWLSSRHKRYQDLRDAISCPAGVFSKMEDALLCKHLLTVTVLLTIGYGGFILLLKKYNK